MVMGTGVRREGGAYAAFTKIQLKGQSSYTACVILLHCVLYTACFSEHPPSPDSAHRSPFRPITPTCCARQPTAAYVALDTSISSSSSPISGAKTRHTTTLHVLGEGEGGGGTSHCMMNSVKGFTCEGISLGISEGISHKHTRNSKYTCLSISW